MLSAGLVEDHKACFPGNAVLRKRLDDWTEAFEAEEDRRRHEAADAQEEQGWTVVKRRGVRLTAPELSAAIMALFLCAARALGAWTAVMCRGVGRPCCTSALSARLCTSGAGVIGLFRLAEVDSRASPLLQFDSNMHYSTAFAAMHGRLAGAQPCETPRRICGSPSLGRSLWCFLYL